VYYLLKPTTRRLSLIIAIKQVPILTTSQSTFLMATTDPVAVPTAAIYVRLSWRFLSYLWEPLLSDNKLQQDFSQPGNILSVFCFAVGYHNV